MNERIKQLAIESEMYVDLNGKPWPKWMTAEECESAYDKFAELIVKECMEQVWYSREDGINGNISQIIKDRIKQHFGVEE
jgi:hypothetical protein